MTDEQIASELGFATADGATKEALVTTARATVDIRVGTIVSELLTDEQLTEFERLQDAGNTDAVWEWLRTSVVGVDMREVYEAALAEYLNEMKAKQAAL